MHARIVRFTDVDRERVEAQREATEDRSGPPEGVPATGIQVFLDEEQRTAVVVQLFETAEDMRTGEAVLDAMDPSDTPGTRASVDRCELKFERTTAS
jgi:hypothetical protein